MKKMLMVLIVVNLWVLVYLLVTPSVKKEDYTSYAVRQEDIKKANGEIDESNYIKPVMDNILRFENEIIVLSNYQGQLNTGNINVKFTQLLNEGFAKLYKDTVGMNSTSLANYLETNKNDIAMQTGITEIADFTKFIQKIQIYKDKELTFEKAEVVEGSYVNGDEYDNFKVKLSYSNEKTLNFDVYVGNRDFMDTPLFIIK